MMRLLYEAGRVQHRTTAFLRVPHPEVPTGLIVSLIKVHQVLCLPALASRDFDAHPD